MADSFLEDPMNMAQLEGIGKPEKLLKAHSLLHTRHAVRCGNLSILDGDPAAFMIGYDSRDEKPLWEKWLMVKIVFYTFSTLNFSDLLKMQANMKRHGKEQIPMVLETHNQRNVGLYEHFGFKLVKTISDPVTTVQQYCMIR